MATPHALLTHVPEKFETEAPAGRTRGRRSRRIRSGLLVGASAALTITLLPGTAAADPDTASSPAQAAQKVADASHRLGALSEQLNEARVVLEEQQAAAESADRAAAEAQARLDALEVQFRNLARTAYTTDGLSQFNALMSSDSADEFLSQLGTLDAIAGHTNDLAAEVADAAEEAESAQRKAAEAEAEAQKAVEEIEAQQKDLEAQVAEYQRQYDELTAAQQEQVSTARSGRALAVPSGVIAPSAAAQAAVDTALAQVGDPYVYGAAGPDAFDCSGLTQYAYSAAGVSLPHSSRSQSTMGAPVSVGELQPGDLLFYYSPTSHVAMYIGNGQMVHASTSGQPVKVVSFDSMSGFTHARRIAG